VQEEVHIDETEDEPVVAAVFKQVEERHSVIRETVNEQGL